VDGQQVAAHLPNSGRLQELLTPGREVWLRPASDPRRRTSYDLLLVEHAGQLVSVDARLPNPLLHEALLAGRVPAFRAYGSIRREARLGRSRLDFLLEDGREQRCWLETKSVTLVEEGIALFPDAPTARGRRHLLELQEAVFAGDRAVVLFVIQRSDAAAFSPHPTADMTFSQTLDEAHAHGVSVLAYGCSVSLSGVTLDSQLPVRLGS
jgi:sugar fermentation stimulation protein A